MSFKKSVVISLVVLSIFALVMGISQRASVEAADVAVVDVKEAPAAAIPTFNATAYIAGHGGHLAVIDMKP
jgi:hypothetical protein